MNKEQYVICVLKALPELEPESRNFPGIKEAFKCDIERKFDEGWAQRDTIFYYRLSEEIDCWKWDGQNWVEKPLEERIDEEEALSQMNRIALKYLKK